jgi:hypothetical protein
LYSDPGKIKNCNRETVAEELRLQREENKKSSEIIQNLETRIIEINKHTEALYKQEENKKERREKRIYVFLDS